MPSYLLPTLLLQILVVGYTPGPANIYALAMSARYGKRAAGVMWAGLLTGFSLGASLMALLTHYVGMAFGSYIPYLRFAGAAYLLYLAYQLAHRKESAGTETRSCSFLTGLLVQLTNAKMLLFDLMVFGTFVLPYSQRLADLFVVAAWLLLAGPGANLVWLLAGSYLNRFCQHHQKAVDRSAALALAGCAVYVLCC
ncbi:MAG: LysE family translocator [Bacteroidaceae bacterium]